MSRIIHDGTVKLNLRLIEKYTSETWPVLECARCKRARLEKEQAMAQITTAQMVRAVLNSEVAQFEAAVLALRDLMESEG